MAQDRRETNWDIRHWVTCLLLVGMSCLGLDGAHAQTNELVLGRVIAWGSDTLNQTNVPPDLTNVIAIAAASVHSVALESDGTVRAWGSGHNGETNVPPGLTNVVGIAAAGFYGNNYGYSLALKDDGTMVGWGAVSLPAGLSNIVEVAAGAYWWMALRGDGTVTANYPYLTNGLLALGAAPPLSNVVAIASGDRHMLALTRDGTVAGWGQNNYGQATGVPSSAYSDGIVTLGGNILSNVVAIAAGEQHSVALKSDGTVVAWGNDAYGQTNVPAGLINVVAISSGGNESADQVIAVKADGHIVAWGGNDVQTNVPPGLTNVMAVSVGSAHSLALLGAGPLVPHAHLSAPAWKGKSFSFSLPTESGRLYTLEHKNSLTNTAWTQVSQVTGNGHLRTLTESNAASSSGFYRALRW